MLTVEYIDLRVNDDQLLILIYIVRQVSDDRDVSAANMATLATGRLMYPQLPWGHQLMYVVVLSADTPSPRLQDIIIISSEVAYEV